MDTNNATTITTPTFDCETMTMSTTALTRVRAIVHACQLPVSHHHHHYPTRLRRDDHDDHHDKHHQCTFTYTPRVSFSSYDACTTSHSFPWNHMRTQSHVVTPRIHTTHDMFTPLQILAPKLQMLEAQVHVTARSSCCSQIATRFRRRQWQRPWNGYYSMAMFI